MLMVWSQLVISQKTISKPLINTTPELVGMSSMRLSRIDTMCNNYIRDNRLPGMVMLVARKGKIAYHKAFGSADAVTKEPLKTNHIFRIASQTKAITSTAVMMLWEEGKFELDDPIEKYIPEFKDAAILDSLYEDGTFTTKPAKNKITIRHLLTHTSGIGYGVIDGNRKIRKIYENAGIIDLYTTEPVKISDNIKKLAKLPLHHEPGEKYTYSEGLDVLGYFIEIMSGKTFDVFLRERIFVPLEMDDTWFYLPDSKSNRLVSVQTKKDGVWQNFPVTFYDPDYPIKGAKTFFSGGAGLVSTALDYAKFLQMYLNGGVYNGKRLLSRTTVNLILSDQIEKLFGPNSDSGFGLAFSILNDNGFKKGNRGSTGTYGWGGYFNTHYFVDPKEEVIGVYLKQTQSIPDDTENKFKRLVSQAIID
jgi:CubicO group peptidase (beta-lactamase class C family)